MFDIRPRLPPKSVEFYKHRKSKQDSLAPVPHPRRSKQVHHKSFPSLPDIHTAPIPAARSFMNSGSTQNFKDSQNSVAENFADDNEKTNIKGVGTTPQSESCIQEPFIRSQASVSLPSAFRMRGRRKKGQAPLPPT